eukprot:scaffold5932_cov96-Skeletonema_dohrnii-CCMP3373.AAC.4
MTQTSTQNDKDVNITSEQPSRNQSQQSSSPQQLSSLTSAAANRSSSCHHHISALKQLFIGAYRDIQKRHIFSPFDSARVLDYFDGVISLVSVFLYEELDYDQLLNVSEDATPLLLSLFVANLLGIFGSSHVSIKLGSLDREGRQFGIRHHQYCDLLLYDNLKFLDESG